VDESSDKPKRVEAEPVPDNDPKAKFGLREKPQKVTDVKVKMVKQPDAGKNSDTSKATNSPNPNPPEEQGFFKKMGKASKEFFYEGEKLDKLRTGRAIGVGVAIVAGIGGVAYLMRSKPDNKVQAASAQLQSRANEPSQGAVLGV
jgi:hypothetical protein